MAAVSTDVASSCTVGTALKSSDEALECHPGIPQDVYFWHFADRSAMDDAFNDLNTELGYLSPVSGNCRLQWNGQGTYDQNGSPAGDISCPEDGPSDIPLLYNQGDYLAWTNYKTLVIGVASDPNALASDLYSWWLQEMQTLPS